MKNKKQRQVCSLNNKNFDENIRFLFTADCILALGVGVNGACQLISSAAKKVEQLFSAGQRRIWASWWGLQLSALIKDINNWLFLLLFFLFFLAVMPSLDGLGVFLLCFSLTLLLLIVPAGSSQKCTGSHDPWSLYTFIMSSCNPLKVYVKYKTQKILEVSKMYIWPPNNQNMNSEMN